LEPGTTYYLRPRSNDILGNQGISGNWTDNSIITVRTKDGPAIKRFTIKETTNTSITIDWSTTTDSNSYIYYSQTKSNGELVIDDPDTPNDSNGVIKDADNYVTFHELKIPNLKVGEKYYFYLKSYGQNGNYAVEDNAGKFYEFTTDEDLVSPVITLDKDEQPILVTDTRVVIQWTTDKATTTQLQYKKHSDSSYTDYAYDQNLFNKSHYVMLEGLTASTNYDYKVTAKDMNGNEDSVGPYTFKTLKDPESDHPPIEKITFASENPSVLTDKIAVIAFTTDQGANCYIKYGSVTGEYNADPIVEEKDVFTKTHSMQIMSLIFSSKYYYKVNCTDNNGNSIESDEQNFTTREKNYTESGSGGTGSISDLMDPTPPDVSSVDVGSITGESVTVTWKTNEKSNSLVKYGIDSNSLSSMAGDGLVSAIADYDTSHTVLINNLIPGTKYYYAVMSYDAAGNIGESSQDSFTTSSPSSLSSIKVESKNIGEATITWSTNNDLTSVVEYGLTTSYSEKKEDTSYSKDHSITLSKLNQGVTYHYRVKGEDKDKNLYASADNTFEPKSPPKITNINVDSVTEHGAVVTFNTDVPTDSNVTYTDVQNASETGSQGSRELETNHKITLENLNQGTTYAIVISAKDDQGTGSDENGSDFTTGKDETPPAIDNVHTDSALTQSDKVQTIISWKTDEQATTSVFYREGRNGDEKELKMNDNLTTSHVAVITSFKPGTVCMNELLRLQSFPDHN
jgi:hypothetical protein